MRVNKWVGLGVVAALGLGSVVWAIPVPSYKSDAPASVTVPVGRIGDEVEYTVHWNESDTVCCDLNGRVSTVGQGVTRYGFRTNGTTVVLDSAGRAAYSLLILRNRTFDESERVLPGRGFSATQARLYLDLGTRDTVRIDGMYTGKLNAIIGGSPPVSPPAGWVNFTVSHMDWEPQWINNSFFAFQGRSFTVGESVIGSRAAASVRTWDEPGQSFWEMTTSVPRSFSSRVEARAVVDGYDAVAVRSVLQATVFKMEDRDDCACIVDVWDDTVERVAWISDEVPYPVRMEFHGRRVSLQSGDGSDQVSHQVMVLRAYQSGNALIPWANDYPATGNMASAREPERSEVGTRYPADGAASSLPYPLAVAIATAKDDPRLGGFHSWLEKNPVHFVAGIRYTYSLASPSPLGLLRNPRMHTWDLAFASPQGTAYVVKIQKDPSTGLLQNQDCGESELRGEKNHLAHLDTGLPDRPVTLAGAERIWADALGPHARRDRPLFVGWGYAFGCGNASVYTSGPRVAAQSVVEVNNEALRLLQFGSGADPAATEGSSPGNRSFVTVDARTGLLVDGEASSHWWVYALDSGPIERALSSPVPVQGARVPTPIRYVLPVLTAASVLVCFLVAYLYPLLKYAGANALGLVPGYAKLHKADLLNNRIREGLLQLIKADPGITPPQLQAHVQAGWSTIVYHLGVLEKNQLVSSLIDGRHKRFFPVGAVDFSKRGQLAALKNDRTRQLYEIVLGEPGLIQRELADRLGVSRPSMLWHVERLEKAGLLGHDRQRRQVHYYANPRDGMVEPYDAKVAVEVT